MDARCARGKVCAERALHVGGGKCAGSRQCGTVWTKEKVEEVASVVANSALRTELAPRVRGTASITAILPSRARHESAARTARRARRREQASCRRRLNGSPALGRYMHRRTLPTLVPERSRSLTSPTPSRARHSTQTRAHARSTKPRAAPVPPL